MDPAGGDMARLARTEVGDLHGAGVVLEMQPEPAAEDVDRLVLRHVLLERQPLAGLDDQQLAAVPVGERPDQLVTPRLRDPAKTCRRGVAHVPRTSRSPWSSSASRIA